MIPKKIHYIWFGKNPLPSIAQKSIASWKKILPEYKIIRWDESNFPINEYIYVQRALELNKYAFASDVARLYVLYKYGGVYLDTDVEILKPLDDFLNHNAFSGYENSLSIPTGIMGSEKKGRWVGDMLSYYHNRDFILPNGKIDMTTNVKIISDIMEEKGMVLNNTLYDDKNYITFYPNDYFSPKNIHTKKINITSNTVCIHHFDGSWVEKNRLQILKSTFHKIIINVFGERLHGFFVYIIRKLKAIGL